MHFVCLLRVVVGEYGIMSVVKIDGANVLVTSQ